MSTDSLSVLVECDALLCAIPTGSVSRLLLDEDVTVVSPALEAEHPTRLAIGREEWLGFDLGELLAVGGTRGAWVLLSLSHRGAPLPIALRTGRCLAVREVRGGIELPRRAFRSRPRALRSAFAIGGLGVTSGAVCGARLDPEGLLEGAPLRHALSALSERRRIG